MKTAARRSVVPHDVGCLVQQPRNLDGVREEPLARGSQNDTAAVTAKEGDVFVS